MILKITEVNHWEKDRWTYLLDTELIGAEAMSLLMSFFRLAKKEYDDYAKSHNMKDVHAISNYMYDFFDRLDGRMLVRRGCKLVLSREGSYQSGGDFRNRLISVRRMKKTRDMMRDKSENIIYKNFPSLFMKDKVYVRKEKV